MTKRLNARIDDELAEKLELLQRRTNKTVTEIVRESIEVYARLTEEQPRRAANQLEAVGFIGCGEDRADLSASYKSLLADLFREKTEQR